MTRHSSQTFNFFMVPHEVEEKSSVILIVRSFLPCSIASAQVTFFIPRAEGLLSFFKHGYIFQKIVSYKAKQCVHCERKGYTPPCKGFSFGHSSSNIWMIQYKKHRERQHISNQEKKKSLITIFPQNWKILLELLLPRARVSFRALFHPTWNTDVDRARWAFVALTSKTITACPCLPCPLQKTAFFFHFLRFYPNIVDWKFCGDFCWTRRESVTDTHIYSFSEPFPIQVITGY